ncbi:reverse transcriptase domain-containing protein [Tanacetum coccineum]
MMSQELAHCSSPDYVAGPEYPKYLAPSDEEVPVEDHPYAIADSPIALSPVQEEEEAFEEEGEEHLALADSVVAPIVDYVPSSEETEPFETDKARKTVRLEPPMSPFMEARIAEYVVAPTPPSPPPSPLSPWEDTPEAELPPRKRLCLTALTSRYEVGESSTAAPRPAGGHGIDYGFIGTLDAKTRRQRAEEVGYGIRDTWVDPREAAEEIAPVTLEGVNTRVTELAAVQEQDTQDIYAVIEDAQDRQTRIFQSVETLIDDRQYHYETARLLDQEALVSREAWAHSMGFSSAVHYELQGYRTHAWMQDHRIDAHDSLIAALTAQNNMPPRRSSATARVTAAAAAAAAPMTAAAVEQLIEARVSAALANHETLRNNTNGHGDGSHNSGIGNRGTTRTPRFDKERNQCSITTCAVENQVKFATCTFVGNALTWWNSHMKAVTQDVAYAMDWKTLKKMMTAKYCPRGEIKKLEIELWNLKVKGTDIPSYTLRFQELALMCGRMFPEESDEVEKYVGDFLI